MTCHSRPFRPAGWAETSPDGVKSCSASPVPSASANAPAVAQRSAGTLASAFCIARSTPAGTVSRTTRMFGIDSTALRARIA